MKSPKVVEGDGGADLRKGDVTGHVHEAIQDTVSHITGGVAGLTVVTGGVAGLTVMTRGTIDPDLLPETGVGDDRGAERGERSEVESHHQTVTQSQEGEVHAQSVVREKKGELMWKTLLQLIVYMFVEEVGMQLKVARKELTGWCERRKEMRCGGMGWDLYDHNSEK